LVPSAGKISAAAFAAEPYVLAIWEKAKVNIDYHVAVDKHYYSAPHSLIHQEVDVRLTQATVELFDQGKRVAAHVRSFAPGQFTTIEEHRPNRTKNICNGLPAG